MTWRRGGLISACVGVALLLLGGALLADGLALGTSRSAAGAASTGRPATSPFVPAPSGVPYPAARNSSGLAPAGFWDGWHFGDPLTVLCDVIFQPTYATYGIPYNSGGPGCQWLPATARHFSGGPNEAVAADNIITTLANYLNITAAGVANMNATFQELLSYYVDRAEAIVPAFLNASAWNDTIARMVVIDSGLVPSIEGLLLAFTLQQFQDWNATSGSWNAAFGPTGPFAGDGAEFNLNRTDTQTNFPVTQSNFDLSVSRPWEYWATGPYSAYHTGNNTTFFNMAPGGTIVDADVQNTSVFGNYTVFDLTQGTQYFVPHVSFLDWTHQTGIVNTSAVHHTGQFDLLKLVCNSQCGNFPVEASGAYSFQPVAENAPPNVVVNNMVPLLELFNPASTAGLFDTVPASNVGACISLSGAPFVNPCDTYIASTEGNTMSLGHGPGSVTGTDALTGYALTAQTLVNNTILLAHDYWTTLHAVTDAGRFTIPANCAIPTPSDAFPAATNFGTYRLDLNDVEAVYLSYLNAIAREYGQVFTTGTGFCGDRNLGFSFNWTGSWDLRLNITASVYVANATTALNFDGTARPNTTLANVSSWPAFRIDPTMLYPYEYQMNVPLNTVYPIPVNNPLTAVLVKYPGNLLYGSGAFSPDWGVPTYLHLSGNGNYSQIGGNLSTIASGAPPAQGDAIVIHSCVLNGVTNLNPCQIGVTYFNNFTIGLVHAILPPVPTPGGGGGLGSLNDCGFGALNQWYDSWAGYAGSAVGNAFAYFGNGVKGIPIIGGGLSFIIDGIGCLLAWVVVILLFALFVYVAVRVGLAIFRGVRGGPRARSENVS